MFSKTLRGGVGVLGWVRGSQGVSEGEVDTVKNPKPENLSVCDCIIYVQSCISIS